MRRLLSLACSGLALFALHACTEDPAPPAGGTSSGDPVDPPGDGGKTEPPAPEPPSKLNTTTEAVDVDGTGRSYVLSVPKTYDASRAYPLVLALHGDGQDGASFRTFLNLEAISGDDAIIAYPDRSEDLFTPYAENADQKLIAAIVAEVKAKRTIDPKKIWGLGYSKGAYQLNEIACRKPGILSAMAIHAGGAPQEQDEGGNVQCPAAQAIATFVTHGENDEPGGGEYGASYWADLAGCNGTRKKTTPAICEAYEGCKAAWFTKL